MDEWPPLPYDSWIDTRETLHRWTQIAGKIRMALTPPVNHWWHVTLYVTPRGLTTSTIPYGERSFDIEFDFVAHVLRIRVAERAVHEIPLGPRSVAELHDEIFSVLHREEIACEIHTMPDEILVDPIPLDRDHQHRSYDRDAVERFRAVLTSAHNVFSEFRGGFIGKCSPVHFFWGSFDLCCTRFSGKPAPERPGADAMTREAYSHEVISGGFWPGGTEKDAPVNDAAFYAYAVPQPEGFAKARIQPVAAFY